MINTPIANRKSIILVGNRNAGKSTIFNALLGQERSIVSDQAGTTTDPVWSAAEIIGFGPVKIVDTAGIDDVGKLGKMRVEKTSEEVKTSDLIIHVLNFETMTLNSGKELKKIVENYRSKDKEFIIVINKMSKAEVDAGIYISLLDDDLKKELNGRFLQIEKDHVSREKIVELYSMIASVLNKQEQDKPLLEGIAKSGDTVILVTPIDSEAPKGRIILPQVQVLRECLDMGIKSMVVRESELEDALAILKKVNLVITDSKVFDFVNEKLDKDIALTSFSILFARQKGDIEKLVEGAQYLEYLKDGDRVLIAESCTHTSSHEDIGTVIIPKLIRKKLNKDIKFDFSHGKTIPEDLSPYSLIIQCGGCMMSRSNMMNRIREAKISNVPITNYGVVLAYLKADLNRMLF